MTTLVEKVLETDFTTNETGTFYRGTITHFYGEGGSRSSGGGGSIFDSFKSDIDRNKGSSGGKRTELKGSRLSPGNYTEDLNLGTTFEDPLLRFYALRQRFDFSGHDQLPPHLNQDYVDTGREDSYGNPGKKILNSGRSEHQNELHTDGEKGLGSAHRIFFPDTTKRR